MKHIKFITIGLATLSLLSATVPVGTTLVQADEIKSVASEKDHFKGLSDNELQKLGFSAEEIAIYHDNLNNPVYLENGIILNSKEQHQERGKFTWAVKAIRKGYNKLPTSVKRYIAAHTGLETLLSFIENATGTIQDAVYNACRKVGMSKSVANIVTAAIMTLIF
ncbi:hypothetical protein GUI51_13435 [Enterococcus mundtii]|uniref:Streptococcin A-M57 n=1 Tax=Enterococcus mundtii TaxID=53346 RepID=A0ABQ0VFP7_ENTMU|nr:hypothetical protein [Enterococcus mundtii]MZU11432.1 hypothetical protein [Bifidobacterium longum]GEN18593.1 hypothetical protein LAC02_18740 [Ligilactobacillus acidipiscis]AUB54426.1 hypothetical protein EM4838_15520 [Enterococcus mundtii]AUB54532.1 hypothetical protein EM4838_16110 [Enterococcus mundtii]MZZ60073.1 hypothetical protein [Enterococcus mundtii]